MATLEMIYYGWIREGNIILSWLIWRSEAEGWGSFLGWFGWSWPVVVRLIRCCCADFDIWTWWFLIIFHRFLGWGPNGESQYFWIMKYSWGTACSCHRSTPTIQHLVSSLTLRSCWGTWWWWSVIPVSLQLIFVTSWSIQRNFHRICIKKGLTRTWQWRRDHFHSKFLSWFCWYWVSLPA